MLKIAVDGGDLPPPYASTGAAKVNSGIQRIVSSFFNQFQNKYFFDYYCFCRYNYRRKYIKNISPQKLPQSFYAKVFLPLSLILSRDQVFLGFSSFIPTLIKWTKIKKILFVYDLGFIKYPDLYPAYEKVRDNLVQSLKVADKIIVLSNTARKDLLNFFPFIKNKNLTQIYPGIDHLLAFKKKGRTKRQPGQYFLYVGVIKPSKKVIDLIECFSRFINLCPSKNFKLVLIGKKEKDYFKKIIKRSVTLKIRNKIIFLENVNDEKLADYYRQSIALINLSREEGFGFPVLEALSLGKPVIVNNLPIYKEYQKYFNNLSLSKNKKEIVDQMITISENPPIIRSPEINPQFTWKNFTREVFKIIDQVADR